MDFIGQGYLFAVFVGYYLKGILKNSFWNDAVLCHRSVLKSRIKTRFFLTYRALKVARNYRPGRRKMGFDLRLGGAMPSGFSHKQLMLAERPSL